MKAKRAVILAALLLFFNSTLWAAPMELGSNDFRISQMGPNGDTNYLGAISKVAYNSTDNEFFVVWKGDDNTGSLADDEIEIWGQRIDADTGALLGDRIRISNMGPDGDSTYGITFGSPDVAYNSTDNEYLVVWDSDTNAGGLVDDEFEIWGQRIDAETGAEIGGDFRISDMGPDGNPIYNAANPKVAYNSTENHYLVVWYGDDNSNGLVDGELETFGQLIDGKTGAEIGSDFQISAMGGANGDANYEVFGVDVAYNSTDDQYLVVWQADDNSGGIVDGEYEIWGRRIEGATGSTIGTYFRISDMGPDGDVNYDAGSDVVVEYNSTDNEYLVVWSGDDNSGSLADDEFEIWGQRIAGATGAESGSDFRISTMGPDGDKTYGAGYPGVAWDSFSNRYLVVWFGNSGDAPMAASELEVFGSFIEGGSGGAVGLSSRLSDMGPDGDSSYAALYPSLAYGSSNDLFLGTWTGDDNTSSLVDGEFEVFGQFYGPQSSLSISKTDGADPAMSGGTLTYTITVTNSSSDSAKSIAVTDTLPGGVSYVSGSGTGWSCSESGGVVTCTLASLGAGSSSSVEITVLLDISISGDITNSAVVSSGTWEDDSSDNTASETTTVTKTTCKLKVKNRECRGRRVPEGTKCRLLTVVKSGGKPVSGVSYELQKKKKGSFTTIKTGTTSKKGKGKKKVRVKKKKAVFQAYVPSLSCTTRKVKKRTF